MNRRVFHKLLDWAIRLAEHSEEARRVASFCAVWGPRRDAVLFTIEARAAWAGAWVCSCAGVVAAKVGV